MRGKNNKIYVFKSNSTGRWSFVFSCMLTILFLIVSFNFKEMPVLQLFVCVIGIKLGVYNSIDYLFSKTLIKQGNKLILKIGSLNFKLDACDSFLMIDKDDITNRLTITSYGLYIVRNKKGWSNRIFKNKIKLISNSRNYDIDQIMKEVSAIFQLKCINMRNV